MTDNSQKTDGTTRRTVLAALASAGVLGASSAAAASDVGVGGGPMSDELSHLNVEVYAGPESELPEPGIEGRYYHVDDGGALWNAGDILEDTGDTWEKIDAGVGSLSAEEAVIGVDPSDGAVAVEDAVDKLPSDGGIVHIRRGAAEWSDRALIDKSNVRIALSDGTTLLADDGSWTTHEIDTNDNIPDQKSFFVFSGVENCTIHGGNLDGDGFVHDFGIDACGVLVHESVNVNVDGMDIRNINPEGEMEFGGWDDDGTPIRYQGILVVKSNNISATRNYVENTKRGAIAARIGCRNIWFVDNDTFFVNYGAQATRGYGGEMPANSDDEFSDGIRFIGNHVSDWQGTGLVHHADSIVIAANYIEDGDSNGDAIRDIGSSGGNVIIGNIIEGVDCRHGIGANIGYSTVTNNIIKNSQFSGFAINVAGPSQTVSNNYLFSVNSGIGASDLSPGAITGNSVRTSGFSDTAIHVDGDSLVAINNNISNRGDIKIDNGAGNLWSNVIRGDVVIDTAVADDWDEMGTLTM